MQSSFNIKHLINSIVKHSLRPTNHDEVPMSVRQLMEIAWNDDISTRPSFESLTKMLKKSFPRRKHMLESMVSNLEHDTRELETEITQKNMEIMMVRSQFNGLVRSAMPDLFAERLIAGDGVTPLHRKCVGVLVVDFVNLAEFIKDKDPLLISNLINEICERVRLYLMLSEVRRK